MLRKDGKTMRQLLYKRRVTGQDSMLLLSGTFGCGLLFGDGQISTTRGSRSARILLFGLCGQKPEMYANVGTDSVGYEMRNCSGGRGVRYSKVVGND